LLLLLLFSSSSSIPLQYEFCMSKALTVRGILNYAMHVDSIFHTSVKKFCKFLKHIARTLL
jgi:hypothetical protein